jgi:hypothetical protein
MEVDSCVGATTARPQWRLAFVILRIEEMSGSGKSLSLRMVALLSLSGISESMGLETIKTLRAAKISGG